MSEIKPRHKTVKRWVIALIAFGAAIIAILATPVQLWRTGRSDGSALDLIFGGPAVSHSSRVWIDTDAACGATPRTDPDDCLAIAWMVKHEGNIVGISTSFGNASGVVVLQTIETLVAKIVNGGHAKIPIWRGWVRPITDTQDTAPPSRAAMRAALEVGPLTILALGPLTNIADALKDRPDLQRNVTRLVAVMGHQPGHLFHPTEASGRGVFMGHGPIFRDLNFSMDEAAAHSILQMQIPLTLIPYDASVRAGITAADLETLAEQGPALRWAANTTKGWLGFWQDDIGQPGFFPFDWIAAAHVIEPSLFNCAETKVWIATEWAFWVYPRESLLVGPLTDGKHGVAVYCPQTDPSLHDYMMSSRTQGG